MDYALMYKTALINLLFKESNINNSYINI